jgi:hypothetical protein
MADTQGPELITYVDSNGAHWQEFRPGSRRKVLYEDPATGQLTMLVQWDPGYQMAIVEHHQHDEHLYSRRYVRGSAPRVRPWHVHFEPSRLGAPSLHP